MTPEAQFIIALGIAGMCLLFGWAAVISASPSTNEVEETEEEET